MISDKTIKTITDADLGLSPKLSGASKSTRTGARAILFDESGRVALVYEHRYDHYKLPGGCVEAGEDIERALRREVKEEVGARVKNLRYLGVVRSRQKFALSRGRALAFIPVQRRLQSALFHRRS